MRAPNLAGALAAAAVVGISTLAAAGAATAPEHGYVTNAMQFPTTNTQVGAFGRDMDRDGTRDNRLGQLYAALANHGLDMTAVQDEFIQAGQIVMLHSLRTPSLANTKNATWQVLYGETTADPDFTGSGTFTVDTTDERSARLPAEIRRHKVRTDAGVVPVRLQGADPFTLRMTKARVFATCIQESCSDGRINGAVSKFQINSELVPQLATLFTGWIMEDCPMGPTSCMADSMGKKVQALFDADENMTVTELEIRTNSVAGPFLKPDLDLVKPKGKDAVSFGFGFTAVRAQLVR